MVLWTHKSHEAACALYAKSGFQMTDERPVHNFGRDLIEQSWERDLGMRAGSGAAWLDVRSAPLARHFPLVYDHGLCRLSSVG